MIPQTKPQTQAVIITVNNCKSERVVHVPKSTTITYSLNPFHYRDPLPVQPITQHQQTSTRFPSPQTLFHPIRKLQERPQVNQSSLFTLQVVTVYYANGWWRQSEKAHLNPDPYIERPRDNPGDLTASQVPLIQHSSLIPFHLVVNPLDYNHSKF